MPLYQLGQRELDLITNCFASVFPVTTLWWGEIGSSKPVIALVGSDGPTELQADSLAPRLKALRRITEPSDEILRAPNSFYNAYQGDWLPRRGSLLNTDEHPQVELLTPVSHRDQQVLQGLRLRRYVE